MIARKWLIIYKRDGLIDAWKDQGRDPECQSGTWKKTLL